MAEDCVMPGGTPPNGPNGKRGRLVIEWRISLGSLLAILALVVHAGVFLGGGAIYAGRLMEKVEGVTTAVDRVSKEISEVRGDLSTNTVQLRAEIAIINQRVDVLTDRVSTSRTSH
jgi:hypothetical protein